MLLEGRISNSIFENLRSARITQFIRREKQKENIRESEKWPKDSKAVFANICWVMLHVACSMHTANIGHEHSLLTLDRYAVSFGWRT